VIDIGGFLKSLAAMGYDGPVTPEPFCAALRELPREVLAAKVGASMQRIWQIAGLPR
jgi:predicted xylose isomerase-like sugar epimerase